ncbi:SURF1 family protein [Glaciihabitans arcticus]|uniref:SURF1-like protein n=1 Tax=Glaciihabitans arcticus TaxID=2668039 RepID=A0A4Q9GSW0_9MICO|nr:SURF1 family protein [Glaciihabitans arcticus]TBN57771.1 SURF1 family protein [Glaciihabitans arcticus]
MWQVARRPRWIGMLFVCLAVAAGFALLGQWQLSRGVETATVVERETETTVPLESIAEPASTISSSAAGQRVSTTGALVPGDGVVLEGRFNDGVEGFWVTGHALTESGVSIAVALGWVADRADAASALKDFTTSERDLTGRYVATEPPAEDDFEAGEQKSMSVAALINQWADAPASVYGGYLVLDDAPAGLDAIDSPVPSAEVTLNWLNVFYAIEWAVFAVFAVFLWFRLVRDEWEREQEDAELELN